MGAMKMRLARRLALSRGQGAARSYTHCFIFNMMRRCHFCWKTCSIVCKLVQETQAPFSNLCVAHTACWQCCNLATYRLWHVIRYFQWESAYKPVDRGVSCSVGTILFYDTILRSALAHPC